MSDPWALRLFILWGRLGARFFLQLWALVSPKRPSTTKALNLQPPSAEAYNPKPLNWVRVKGLSYFKLPL